MLQNLLMSINHKTLNNLFKKHHKNNRIKKIFPFFFFSQLLIFSITLFSFKIKFKSLSIYYHLNKPFFNLRLTKYMFSIIYRV